MLTELESALRLARSSWADALESPSLVTLQWSHWLSDDEREL